MKEFKKTVEQEKIIEHIKSGKNLKVLANAGSAKTSTLVMAAEECVTPILYLTFNRNMADEAKEKFPPWVEVRTTHSLAYQKYGDMYRNKLKRPVGGYRNVCGTPSEVAKYFKIAPIQTNSEGWITSSAIGKAVLDTLKAFQYSDKEDIAREDVKLSGLKKFKKNHSFEDFIKVIGSRQFEDYKDVVFKNACLLWKLRVDVKSNILITHDTYLKLYQLSKPDLSDYNIIMMDEAHDSNLCVVDIVNNQNIQKVVVGDYKQQIYSWRGSVNSLDLFDFEILRLTKSFRYGQELADVASKITGDSDMYGWENINTNIISNEDDFEFKKYTAIFRTNAAMLQDAVEKITQGAKVNIEIDMRDFISLVESTLSLKQGILKGVKHQSLLAYESWEELYSDREFLSGDVQRVIKLVESGGVYSVLGALRSHKNSKDADITYITASKSKGLEWDNVVLGDDFPRLNGGDNVKVGNPTEENNILYVAATRARKNLMTNDSVQDYLYASQGGVEVNVNSIVGVSKEMLDGCVKDMEEYDLSKNLMSQEDVMGSINSVEKLAKGNPLSGYFIQTEEKQHSGSNEYLLDDLQRRMNMMSEVVIRVEVRSLLSNSCDGDYCYNLGDYEVFYNQVPKDYWDTLTDGEKEKYISKLEDEYIKECVSLTTTVGYTDE